MNFTRYFLIIAASLITVSCAIEMNMYVDKSYSGSMELKIDISEMIAFMGPLDSLSAVQKDSVFNSMNPENEITEAELAQLEEAGLTNFKFDVNEEFVTIQYDYTDINDAYNLFFVMDSAATETEKQDMMQTQNFKLSDDRMTILFSEGGITDLVNNSMSPGGDSDEIIEDMDMSFMLNLFTIKQSYTFERKISEVIDNDLPIRVKENEVYFTINFSEYLEEFMGKEITVLFESEGKKKKRK